MKKICVLFSAIVFFSICSKAQAPFYQWAKNLGNSTYVSKGNSIGVDGTGNVYVAGNFRGTVDFDPGAGVSNLTATGVNIDDIFFAKYTSTGNFVWAKRIGGAGVDVCTKLVVTSTADVFIVGSFFSTVDFDPNVGIANLTSGGSGDGYFAKYDGSGNLVWAHSLGSTASDFVSAIKVDGSGNSYITGTFGSTVDFDPGVGVQNLVSPGPNKPFVAKYDSGGNYVWAIQMSGTGSDGGSGMDIAIDASNNCYVIGKFTNTLDFDPSATTVNKTSVGLADIFLAKYTSAGTYSWVNQFGGVNDDGIYSLCIDVNGASNVYITGDFNSVIDFDPGAGTDVLTSCGVLDMFLGCYDQNGNYIFTGQIGCTQIVCYDIQVDPSNNVFVTGEFTNGGPADFDPTAAVATMTTAASQDVFIAKYDSFLNYIWSAKLGATTYLEGYGIYCDGPNVYITGSLQNTADFDPNAGVQNLTAVGPQDIFIGKYDVCSLAPSTPGAITGTTTICSGSSNTYSITAVAGATSYTWTLPGGWTGVSTTNSITTTANATSGNVSVTANNACGNSTAQTLAITVNNIPATPGTISGTATICNGSTNTYSLTPIAGATSYTWTLPGGWTGTSTTNSITATASGTSGNVTVTATNSCGTSSAQTFPVAVTSIPATPGTIFGSASICIGSSNTYSITSVAGATSYTWILPSGWSGTSTTTSITTTASGTGGNVIVVANNTCGSSSAQTLAVTVNPLPTVTYSQSPSLVCVNATSVALGTVSPTGGIFSGTAVTGSTFNATTAGTGTFTITYTYSDINSCVNTATSNIVVSLCTGVAQNSIDDVIAIYPNPATSVTTISGIEGEAQIILYNVLGKIVLSQQITKDKTEIDLSKETNGIYFMKIITEKGTITKRIIKQ